jgi:hypothetical protein
MDVAVKSETKGSRENGTAAISLIPTRPGSLASYRGPKSSGQGGIVTTTKRRARRPVPILRRISCRTSSPVIEADTKCW